MVQLLIASFLLVTLAHTAFGEPFNFTQEDLNKELGYFGECNGKKITHPLSLTTQGMASVQPCIAEVSSINNGKVEKQCVGLCIAMKLGIVTDKGLYDFDKASKPLNDTVSSGPGQNEPTAVQGQLDVLKECGVGKTFTYEGNCKESQEFDKCVQKGAEEKCGVKSK